MHEGSQRAPCFAIPGDLVGSEKLFVKSEFRDRGEKLVEKLYWLKYQQ